MDIQAILIRLLEVPWEAFVVAVAAEEEVEAVAEVAVAMSEIIPF
jgi:hypothetical protein